MALPNPASVPAVTAEQATPSVAPLAGPINPITWEERPLYGGAITAAIPKRFNDCSDFRHIPDHQEVWADADTDQSVIIELNSLDDSVSDAEAAMHYMRELAAANEAHSMQVVSTGVLEAAAMPGFDAGVHKSFMVSTQLISKFKESSDKANTIQIYLAVLRLRRVETDLLVSFNVPVAFGAGSSSAGRSILASEENRAVVEGLLKSIQIKDWGLFGQ